MKIARRAPWTGLLATVLVSTTLAVAGCDDDDGLIENAGEAVEDVADDVSDAVD